MNTIPSPDSFMTLSQAREAYVNLMAAHQQATSETEAVRGDLSAASEMLDEANQTISNLRGQIDAAAKEKETIAGELTQSKVRIEEITTQLEKLKSEAKSAEARAAEICASVGVDPVATAPESDAKVEDIREQFHSIKDPGKRTAFFRKHREDLIAQ